MFVAQTQKIYYNIAMIDNKSLTITDDAAKKVHNLRVQQGDESLMLRISIAGGGCHGFQYKFAFENTPEADDFSFHKDLPEHPDSQKKPNPITIIIDPISMGYLRGAKVDYVRDGQGERFVIRNPNASTTCGCDRSFTT